MRRLIVTEFLTLDDVMEAPDQWSFPYWNEEIAKFKYDELFESDALLLGRVTYQGFAAAWPSRSDEAVVADITAGGGSSEGTEFGGFADRMNSVPKFVVSRTLEQVEWNNSRLIRENVAEEVSKLKHQPGQDILIAGSADLVHTLTQDHLIDEYRLLVYPVVRGSGKRLFKEGDKTTLKLVQGKTFSSGVVLLRYDQGKDKEV